MNVCVCLSLSLSFKEDAYESENIGISDCVIMNFGFEYACIAIPENKDLSHLFPTIIKVARAIQKGEKIYNTSNKQSN